MTIVIVCAFGVIKEKHICEGTKYTRLLGGTII